MNKLLVEKYHLEVFTVFVACRREWLESADRISPIFISDLMVELLGFQSKEVFNFDIFVVCLFFCVKEV